MVSTFVSKPQRSGVIVTMMRGRKRGLPLWVVLLLLAVLVVFGTGAFLSLAPLAADR